MLIDAAEVQPLDVLHALTFEPMLRLVDRHDGSARGARDPHNVARVIRVAVRQQDQVGGVDLLAVRGTGRVAFQPRVGDDAFAAGSGEDEGRVAQPGDRRAMPSAGSIIERV